MTAMTLDGTVRARRRRGSGLRGKAARQRKRELANTARKVRQHRRTLGRHNPWVLEEDRREPADRRARFRSRTS